MSDDAEMNCAGRLFYTLVAETGKARLTTVVRLKDGTTIGQRSMIAVSRWYVSDAGANRDSIYLFNITRKLCYRKDDRAMHPVHGFGTP